MVFDQLEIKTILHRLLLPLPAGAVPSRLPAPLDLPCRSMDGCPIVLRPRTSSADSANPPVPQMKVPVRSPHPLSTRGGRVGLDQIPPRVARMVSVAIVRRRCKPFRLL